jgi:hypothetical protein
MYELTIKLSPEEERRYLKNGIDRISELAEDIRSEPKKYWPRMIESE